VIRHQSGVVVFPPGNSDRNAFRHGTPDVLEAIPPAIATEHPDDSLLPVPLPEKLAVRLRVRGGEHLLVSRIDAQPASPGGQKGDVQPQAVGFFDDVVHMVPVIVLL
jgi:hypothetical protein